ncbi:phage baseplate protein [Acinetobacter bereziniae]|uniref:phage baseplate protein n=1 Tax=Acinetobacter bereziniae TaxID=106648 RepID=UPI00301A24AB
MQEELANAIEGFGKPLNPNNNAQLLEVLKESSQQSNNLEQRVALLENFVENSVDFFYPVGIIVDFGIFNIDPNVRFVGTTWVRHGEGRASVGLVYADPNAPAWTRTVGSTFGSFTHQLTIDELPRHYFVFKNQWAGLYPPDVEETLSVEEIGWAKDNSPDTLLRQRTEVIGKDKAHNNVQPSIVDARWRRVA